MPKTHPIGSRPLDENPPELSRRGLLAAGFLAVACQRFGIPLGDQAVPLSAIVLGVCYIRLFATGWQISPIGVALWSGLMFVGALSSVLNPGSHLASFGLLALTYLPLVLLPVKADQDGRGRDFLDGAVAAIKLGAILGIVQALLQWAGQGFWDPITSHVPDSLLVSGFNTVQSTQYAPESLGLGHKPNGVLFLEPSFLSFYSALGIVWLVQRKIVEAVQAPKLWGLRWIAVLIATIAVSIATTGLVVLAAAALPLVPRLFKYPRLLAALTAIGFLGWRVGAFDAIFAKSVEGFDTATSSSLRLKLPYELLLPHVGDNLLLGSGPGTGSDLVATFHLPGLQDPTIVKALLEYGLLGAAFLAMATLYTISSSKPSPMLMFAVLAAWLVPSEALLNPVVAALLFLALPRSRVSDPSAQSDTTISPGPSPRTKRSISEQA